MSFVPSTYSYKFNSLASYTDTSVSIHTLCSNHPTVSRYEKISVWFIFNARLWQNWSTLTGGIKNWIQIQTFLLWTFSELELVDAQLWQSLKMRILYSTYGIFESGVSEQISWNKKDQMKYNIFVQHKNKMFALRISKLFHN